MQIQPTKVNRSENLSDVKDFAQNEHMHTSYVDIPDRMMMFDTENFNEKYFFNEDGIKSLFYATGVNGLFPCMQAVEDNQVVSAFVSKLFEQESVKKRLESKQLVVQIPSDERRHEKTIVGVVGKHYNKISNHTFLDYHSPDGLGFERGMFKNTTMHLDFTEESRGIELKDNKRDQIKIGQRWINDMRGMRRLSFELFVLTLACTNGMMMKSRSNETSLVHRGNQNLYDAFDSMNNSITSQYKHVREAVKTLFDIPFDQGTARKLLNAKAPVGIIEAIREKKLYSKRKKYDTEASKNIDLDRSVQILQNVPEVYGGAVTKQMWDHKWRDGKNSMFQWLGAFTEYAQTQKPDVQIQIEEDAGNFVNWMHKNKQQFLEEDNHISLMSDNSLEELPF